jgi:hypothetical protein
MDLVKRDHVLIIWKVRPRGLKESWEEKTQKGRVQGGIRVGLEKLEEWIYILTHIKPVGRAGLRKGV